MCGIAGYSVAPGGHLFSLDAAVEAMRHRGPDSNGVFYKEDHGLGLAHTRLSIQDLSSLGNQPMLSEDKSTVIVFNGEIYNFHELRKDFERSGHRFNGNSDTEVLLRLYQEEGPEMLRRLNGIFAIAIWDQKNKSLFVARDALGVKPFYFVAEDGLFAFASEVKALASIYPNLRSMDCDSLQRYIAFLWCPGEGTPSRSIRKLVPGRAMVVQNGEIRRSWNWYQ